MQTKVVIVTGAGSGLGFAIASKFASQGYTVVMVGRNKEKLDKAKEQIKGNCYTASYDLAKLETIPHLVKWVLGEFGRIDVLVNNAGINQKKPLTEVTDEEFQQVITTNLTSVFCLSREVVKYMLTQKAGCILNISSMAAQYGLPKVIAYSASKTAIDGLTRAMAVELGPEGIRVNAIAPGFIYSDMTAKALDADPERKAKVFGRTPMGIMGQPEDIAEAAWYLCNPQAKFVTGVVLPVDGGNSIGF
ncbi:MAG TPA: SDR family oxidoreductase [Phnomibacter sp.]|nr:SDR family oxidoreductase [Phnomibacter sp.]